MSPLTNRYGRRDCALLPKLGHKRPRSFHLMPLGHLLWEKLATTYSPAALRPLCWRSPVSVPSAGWLSSGQQTDKLPLMGMSKHQVPNAGGSSDDCCPCCHLLAISGESPHKCPVRLLQTLHLQNCEQIKWL